METDPGWMNTRLRERCFHVLDLISFKPHCTEFIKRIERWVDSVTMCFIHPRSVYIQQGLLGFLACYWLKSRKNAAVEKGWKLWPSFRLSLLSNFINHVSRHPFGSNTASLNLLSPTRVSSSPPWYRPRCMPALSYCTLQSSLVKNVAFSSIFILLL